MSSHDDLPAALPAMWRALKRGYQAEPRLLAVAFGLSLLAASPTRCWRCGSSCSPTECRHDRRGARWPRRSGWACRQSATWFLRVISDRIQRRFRDRVTIALESHVAQLQASVATIEHHERPDYLEPARGAARPGLRARSHVHVAVLDLRLDPAARRDRRAA